MATNHIYYFAYGAHLREKVLCRSRKISIVSCFPARLEHFSLRFTAPGIPLVEPVFANIHVDEDEVCYGVVYRLSDRDMEKILRTEGDLYQPINVKVLTSNNKEYEAVTLISTDRCNDRYPSRRYIEMIKRGAFEHGLSSTFISLIEKQKYSYIPVLSELLAPMARLILKAHRRGMPIIRILNSFDRKIIKKPLSDG